ncbi:MAG: GAF domain-containing sensor histidine kinase [Chloroflexota bacterium]|nr:GAF domain-containing sensor histidine kinase [Chloroflexota bacterium]
MDRTVQRIVPPQVTALSPERQAAAMATLLETSAAVAASLDLDALLDQILAAVGRLVPSERASVTLDVPGRDVLKIACVRGDTDYVTQLLGQERAIHGSLTGRAYRTGESFLINDLLAPQWRDDLYLPTNHPDHHEHYRSALMVPLIAERPIGAFYLARPGMNAFTPDDLYLLKLFAPQVAIAVTNARRYASAQEQANGLQSLLRVSERFAGYATHDQENPLVEMARVIAEEAVVILPHSYTALWRLDPEGGRLQCLVFLRSGAVEPLTLSLAVGEGLTGWAVQHQEPLLVNDSQNDARSVFFFDENHVTLREHIMVLPLIVAGQATGALTFVRRDASAYTIEEFARAQLFARQAATSMERAIFTTQLQEQNAALVAANRHKSAFLANVSHELRTPLNAIIGFAQLLADRVILTADEQELAYQDILESGKHLLLMVNNILDVARIEAGHQILDRVAFPLAPEVAVIERMLTPLIATKEQSFFLTLPDDVPDVIADRDRLRQVLLNLLSNAHKFTPPGGTITLTASRTGPETVRITVEDTGIGIAPEHQTIVFEAFQQVESGYARTQQGTGLGLALTKQLVELMGGTITLQSALGVGSAFTLTLPAVPA